MTDIKENTVYNCIISRTSVRKYTSEQIPAEYIDALLHAGMSAPTGVNRQPWEFIVINDKDTLKKLSESLPYAKMTANAPIAIVICGNRNRFLEGEDSTLWVQDLSAASENILLTAHSLGLGGVWTCLYPHDDRMKAVCDILDIPEDIIPFNLIPVGFPATEHKPIDKWHTDRVHYNKY